MEWFYNRQKVSCRAPQGISINDLENKVKTEFAKQCKLCKILKSKIGLCKQLINSLIKNTAVKSQTKCKG